MYEFVAESFPQIVREHSRAKNIDDIQQIGEKWMRAIDKECGIKYLVDEDGLEQGILDGAINSKRTLLSQLKKVLTPNLALNDWNSVERVVGGNRNRKKVRVPLLYNYLRLDQITSNAIKEVAQERLKERHEEYVPIDMDALIVRANEELTARSWYRRLLALMLLTGRRPYEVASTARFVLNDKGETVFHGQIKGKNGKAVRDGYVIPLLAPYNIINQTLEQMRADKPEMKQASAELFHSRACKQYGEQFTQHWKGLFPIEMEDLTPYALRRVYAAICFERYGGRKMPTTYMASILGHSESDVHTALHYIQFVGNNQ